ncbi:unnamed protein product [Closterium sp. Naga37s-1]|nr:unnamed protein product [Closterium sp. Naga37s-1]
MAPRKKRASRAQAVEEQSPPAPRPDPPFVVWMKQQMDMGISRLRLIGVTDSQGTRRPGVSPNAEPTAVGLGDAGPDEEEPPIPCEEDGAYSDDESYCDSDGFTAADAVDDDGDEPVDPRDPKGKRKASTSKPKKSHWTDDELTERAAAMWMAKGDWDNMKGKQGAQPWKKMRRVLRNTNPEWRRPSDAMAKQWTRLKLKMGDILTDEAQSGAVPIPKPDWFLYVYNFVHADRAPNPHVVDEGGARHANAQPTRTTAPLGNPDVGIEGTPPPTIPVRRRAMESPAYAGHLLVADTITRIMNERNSRQDAAFERLLAVLERMAPAPSSKEPPATGGTASPGGRSGTTPSDGPPRSDPSTAPSVIMAPPSSAPYAADPLGARQIFADPSYISNVPPPLAQDSNGQWYFTTAQAQTRPPHGA